MKDTSLYLSDSRLFTDTKEVLFETVTLKNDTYFKIENIDQMAPFFMTIVSDVDFWLFVSSTGGVTAGRKSPETALFPYYTDDKIHDSKDTTGPDACFMVTKQKKTLLWKPFSIQQPNVYKTTRNLYKNTIGNKIVFEEVNHDLELIYRYTWSTSNKYGLVKESEFINNATDRVSIKVLDGIRNILPYGVDVLGQISRSTLIDGYKRSELIQPYGLGIYALSSIISDKAEPSESLKATVAWSVGIETPVYLLSEQQTKDFISHQHLQTELDVKGRRGAYYIVGEFNLASNETREWLIVADLNQTASKIEVLIDKLNAPSKLLQELKDDIELGCKNLRELVFDADGFQATANTKVANRHFSNTLYNIMRGGIYADDYRITTSDFIEFVSNWNKLALEDNQAFLSQLKPEEDYFELVERVDGNASKDLSRLVREYLPLTYSRRHGDPSRPWNKFNIDIAKPNGEKNLNFEGNWRDIFQNWEALSLSYPGYIEGIITKFVNASTADGYNPYRITKQGVDWEVLDSADPWSNIGYWGDHQVIYLLKLLELSKRYHPDKLNTLLDKEIFVYANVPYRIKGLDDLIKDPKNTILFDKQLAKQIDNRVETVGADGKLMHCDESLYHVNLMEKLLVVALVKLTNFIPRGGIWMNTQRPEWNDANNALVGNGVSMVTLYYLYRYLSFLEKILEDIHHEIILSKEVAEMFLGVDGIFDGLKHALSAISNESTFVIVKQLGFVGETYRGKIYAHGFTGDKATIGIKQLRSFVKNAKMILMDSIVANKREDNLYHAYNLVKFGSNSCQISHLYEMLEGQVAVLSSGALNAQESIEVLKALKSSQIYREDQNSYMLYPNRQLPKFLEKNIIPEASVMGSSVLRTELEKGLTRFIEKSILGKYHFNGDFRNGIEIANAIIETGEYTLEEAREVGELYSELFDHHSYTGRSGTFYKYEGLGCIYWHMVSKLVLAVQETHEAAFDISPYSDEARLLSDYFHETKAGIGVDKTPVQYGAFPTDAYSHTPGFAGVQQPGMTGQVKEDILSRFNELGVSVAEGEIIFNPKLLAKDEFFKMDYEWHLPKRDLTLNKNQIGFTVCTIPIVYELSNFQAITIIYDNGDRYTFENAIKLNREISSRIFKRDRSIEKVIVRVSY